MYIARGFLPYSPARQLRQDFNGQHFDARHDELWATLEFMSLLFFPLDEPLAIEAFLKHYRRWKWCKRSDRKKARRFVRRTAKLRIDPYREHRKHDVEWIQIIEAAYKQAIRQNEEPQLIRTLRDQALLLRAKVADRNAYKSPLYVYEGNE